jgi:hypothetical protein
MSCSIWRRSRLAAGQAQLAHAQADEHGGGPGDLLEAQQRGVGQEVVLVIEHLLGHAVAAAEVAAVGHRDAQVAQRRPRASSSGVANSLSEASRHRRGVRRGG